MSMKVTRDEFVGVDRMGEDELRDLAHELLSENARLRKLVRDMCDLLPHADWPSTECDEKASACIDQAIELGIEADA